MKKITDKNIYLAIDERIDRVVEQFDNKIDDRVKFAQIQADKIHKLEKRNKVLEEITEIIISRLADKNDDLKKYILNMPIESIIDRLYALEQNDFNNVMGKAHATLKRVKNNKMEGK